MGDSHVIIVGVLVILSVICFYKTESFSNTTSSGWENVTFLLLQKQLEADTQETTTERQTHVANKRDRLTY